MHSVRNSSTAEYSENRNRPFSSNATTMDLAFLGHKSTLDLSRLSEDSSPARTELEGSNKDTNNRFYLKMKRGGDVMASAAGLAALLPILAGIALLIRAEGRGPILYSQERVGKNGRRFKFYKFRSMVLNADAIKAQYMQFNEASGPIFKMKNDPRVTRVGRILRRYSLDELPQLWNVFRGDMSLVGPRPHLPAEVSQYSEEQEARLLVEPGLICLREVSGRSRLSFEQWVEMDLAYIRNRSLKMDVRILMKAIPAIIKADGAF
jgi:lipopolysaccharide/colanic/teichoic acid biosynthesis glycosyltransferase